MSTEDVCVKTTTKGENFKDLKWRSTRIFLYKKKTFLIDPVDALKKEIVFVVCVVWVGGFFGGTLVHWLVDKTRIRDRRESTHASSTVNNRVKRVATG